MPIKSISIRVDSDLLDKLHYVSSYDGRSANGEINVLIRQLVEEFERQHGEIPIGKKKK